MELEPYNYIDRIIYVYWGGDQKWYRGVVIGFEPDTNIVEVKYEDGVVNEGELDPNITHLGPQKNSPSNEFVGKRLAVYGQQGWCAGTIADYNPGSSRALILYDNGRKVKEILTTEKTLFYFPTTEFEEKVFTDQIDNNEYNNPTVKALLQKIIEMERKFKHEHRFEINQATLPKQKEQKPSSKYDDTYTTQDDNEKLELFNTSLVPGPKKPGPNTLAEFQKDRKDKGLGKTKRSSSTSPYTAASTTTSSSSNDRNSPDGTINNDSTSNRKKRKT